MPPREISEDFLHGVDSRGIESRKVFGERNDQIQHEQAILSEKKKIIFFRIGPFRFGFHGVGGFLSMIVTSIGLWKSYNTHPIGLGLSSMIVSTSLVTALGSYDLLNQVPTTSQISSWIFPPHKEAFKRTIAVVGFLNLRLVHQWEWFINKDTLLFPMLLFLYTNFFFFPTNINLANGNTWVFVLPMFLGLNIDCWKQFPRIESWNTMNTNWGDVRKWNNSQVDETYLLLTLWCSLQIAFMFTIAFRGKMSIRSCYWIAALEVSLLCIRLIQS